MLREPIVNLKSTYAIATQPLPSLEPWNSDWIMWETKRPYLYLRATTDNRLLAGGEDDDFYDPTRRDRNLPQKSKVLLDRLRKLLPGLDLEVDVLPQLAGNADSVAMELERRQPRRQIGSRVRVASVFLKLQL